MHVPVFVQAVRQFTVLGEISSEPAVYTEVHLSVLFTVKLKLKLLIHLLSHTLGPSYEHSFIYLDIKTNIV